MRGTFVIAKFGFIELTRGKLFWVILIIALAVNIALSWGGWYAASKSTFSNEIQEGPRHHIEYMQGEAQYPLGFDPNDPDLPLAMIKNGLRWMVYIVYIFFGNLLSIFGAIGLLGSELENRSIYTLISKPLSRSNIFFGKLYGLTGALLIYGIIMIIVAQLFFMISGAGLQLMLFPAAAVGFINFLIFGTLALMFSIRVRPILAGVLSVIVLWTSTNAGITAIKAVGKAFFKLSDKVVNYADIVLPSQKSIGGYAIHFLFDKYYQAMMGDLPKEWINLISNDIHVLIQPVIWLGFLLLIGYFSFFRREFD